MTFQLITLSVFILPSANRWNSFGSAWRAETAYEPGLTSSNSRVVVVEIDPSLPCNESPEPQREDDEWSLRVIVLPLKRLKASLDGILYLTYPSIP